MLLMPFKFARTFVRIAGIRGVFFLAVGVGIGLLIAPTSGARLRAKLRDRLAAAGVELPSDAGPVGTGAGTVA